MLYLGTRRELPDNREREADGNMAGRVSIPCYGYSDFYIGAPLRVGHKQCWVALLGKEHGT